MQRRPARAPLPPVRQLAGDLGVNLNTVAVAYRESQSEWLLSVGHDAGATVAVMPAGVFYFIHRMTRVNADPGARFGEDCVPRAGDEGHWRHGGLTYHNPGGPALAVEKLVGLGYTINTAHPSARRRLLLLAGIPAFVARALVAL